MAGRRLEAALAETFPVAAAAFVKAHGYGGPVFNDYDWGGYLMWRLPHLSVSLDGRNTFRGDGSYFELGAGTTRSGMRRGAGRYSRSRSSNWISPRRPTQRT